MSRSAKFLALVPAAVLVAGCEDTVTNTSTETQTTTQSFADAKATGSIALVVRDQVSGNLLTGVKATLLGLDGATTSSDSSGTAKFASVVPGSRLVRVEKAGYAARLVSADLVDGSSDAPRVHDYTGEVLLPKLGASVTGKVYFIDKLGNHNVDSGATVYLEYQGEGWVNGLFSAVTDKDGAYRFDSLPEGIQLKVTIRSQKLANGTYASDASYEAPYLKVGEVRSLPNFELKVDAEEFALLTKSIDALPESTTVSLNFSAAVDTAALRKGDITVTSGKDEVAIVPAWSNGNKTLTLKPFSGKWITGSNDIALNVKSVLGQSVSTTLTFTAGTVGALPAAVASLHSKATVLGKEKVDTVDGNTASVTFTWNKALNADGYVLYKKSRKDNAFTKVGSTSDAKDTVLSLNTTEMFDKGDTVTFAVAAFNAKGYSPIETGKLVLTDVIAPKLVADPGDFVVPVSMDNSASTKDSLKTNTLTFDFSEPVDTTARPSFSISNNVNAAAKINTDSVGILWKWESATQGKATLYVLPKFNADKMDVDVEVTITSIKDENGHVAYSPKAEYLILRAKQ